MNLDSRKRDLGRCTYCPKLCRFCCPVAEVEHRETVTPWAKMSFLEMVRLQRLLPGGETGEIFYHCLACLHCRTHCRHGVDVPGALVEGRALALQAGGGDYSRVNAVLNRFRTSGNAHGEDLGRLFLQKIKEQYLLPDAQAAIFFGCEAVRLDQNLPAQTFGLLEALGVDYVGAYMGEELCCGLPLWQAGDLEGFYRHAEKLRSSLSRYRTVICPCPACVYVLSALYAEKDLAPRCVVLHLTDFLSPLLQKEEPRRKISGRYTYHDPCYLGRYLEKTQPPREMLARVLAEPLAEPVWTGADASCCGGGGLVPHVLPEVARGVAALRVEQLRNTGAEQVVTACPGCVRQLSAAENALPVRDITALLLEAYRRDDSRE